MEQDRKCGSCEYAMLNGDAKWCINSESEYCGLCTGPDFCCEKWEEKGESDDS